MIDVETRPPEWYIGGMSRPPTNKEKKIEKISAKVTKSLKDEIADLMEKHDRTESYVAFILMMRGLAAYNQGEKLFEPNGVVEPNEESSTTKARVLKGHKRAERKTSRQA